MCSKANMFCHLCINYVFLYYDGQGKAIFKCEAGNKPLEAEITNKCKYKVEN